MTLIHIPNGTPDQSKGDLLQHHLGASLVLDVSAKGKTVFQVDGDFMTLIGETAAYSEWKCSEK